MKRIKFCSYYLLLSIMAIAQEKESLKDSFYLLSPVEVKAIRASENAPFTKTNLSKREIQKTNLGQDIPFLLNQTPSVVINADAGNGVGYTGIRIRGSDATRINVTLNGIPYNDAESQGSFFVDLPDITSSTGSIQIQRGVGTSSNGAGAFGGSINISTNEVNKDAYAEVNNSYGSFDTWKNTLKLGSGLYGGHFITDLRLSRISSNGFIDRASSDLKSFYFSNVYIDKRSSLRLNIFSGKEKTYQAWNGIPEAKLKKDVAGLMGHYWNNYGYLYKTAQDSLNLFDANNRSYNYFTYKNQTDNYRQNHYQLFYNKEINKNFSFNIASFLTRGKGYYEEYKADDDLASYNLPAGNADLVRRLWLDNYFYGGIYSFQYKKDKKWLTLGGGYTRYDGNHYGEIIWAAVSVPKNYRWYRLDALKTDLNIYLKEQTGFAKNWNYYYDLQYRQVEYNIDGFRNNPTLIVKNKFHFFNPKAGISYNKNGWKSYLSYSIANKEPNREDFESGADQKPKPEQLHDIELGIEKSKSNYSCSATLYYMRYKDQLVLTGKINDVGAYTRSNIPKSYRLGLELQGAVKLSSWFNAAGNFTVSRNRVLNFAEFIDDYDNGGQKINNYRSTDIAYSPAIVSGATINFLPLKNFEISLLSKYVDKQYLDNTGNSSRQLNAFFIQDVRFIYTVKMKRIKEVNFIGQLNNIFNKKYEPNGYTYSYIYGGNIITENFYFPMSGTNFILGLNVKL